MSASVFNPIGETTIVAFDVAERVKDLSAKKIGLIDNMKPNAGLFLDNVAKLIKAKIADVEFIKVRKALTTNSAIAHELEGRVDVAINAWGD